jgi:hypothetical protein
VLWVKGHAFLISEGGLMEQSPVELVDTVISLFANRIDADDEQIEESLLEQNINAMLAEQLIAFVPLAFGRVLLEQDGPRFQPTYTLENLVDRSTTHLPLRDQPLYKAAYKVASEWRGSREEFWAIAGRSPEVKAINSALQDGAELQNLILSEPMVFTQHVATMSPRPAWWQFWKQR